MRSTLRRAYDLGSTHASSAGDECVRADLAALLLGGCAGSAPDIQSLPTHGRVDYQLGGAWGPPDDVTVVARDRTDEPLDGVYSICYLNDFQTQPGEAQAWPLTMDDNLSLATTLVDRAHSVGLAAGQKNSLELRARGRDEAGFDFVVVE